MLSRIAPVPAGQSKLSGSYKFVQYEFADCTVCGPKHSFPPSDLVHCRQISDATGACGINSKLSVNLDGTADSHNFLLASEAGEVNGAS